MSDDVAVDDLRDREPGEDPEDPYANTDISELPEWWRDAIREFREAGLRPYRPPRFEDGTLTPAVVHSLESALDVTVRLVCFDGTYRADWAIEVDGTVTGEIGRHRSPEGYTVFEVESDEFEARIRAHVDERD